MYIYHALINALSAHMIHINLNVIFYTHTHTDCSRLYLLLNKLHTGTIKLNYVLAPSIHTLQ